MPLPSLPLDVWLRISSFLDPDALSALSLVNRMLHTVALDTSHFRRHLWNPPKEDNFLVTSFRRMSALHHPPAEYSVTQTSSSLRIVGTMHGVILCFDADKGNLIVFPSGITVKSELLFGCSGMARGTSQYAIASRQFTELPERNIGFLIGASRSALGVLNLESGHVIIHQIPKERRPHPNPFLLLAGSEGQWIIYGSDDVTLQFFDWRNGSPVGDIKGLKNCVGFMQGGSSNRDSRTIVGIVHRQVSGTITKVWARGFDGVEDTFYWDGVIKVYSVLRSEDTKTHVLLIGDPYESPTEFLAHRRCDETEKWWGGVFKGEMLQPVLRENGNVISASDISISTPAFSKVTQFSSKSHLWTVLKDDAPKFCTLEEVMMDTCQRTIEKAVWVRRTAGGGLAITVGINKDVVRLIRIFRVGREFKHECLKAWNVTKLKWLRVVDDHYILAISQKDEMMLWHFGKFCNGSEVCTCPLKGLMTYCYFPSELRQ